MESSPAVDAVLNAIRKPGPAPHIHQAQMERLAREWPTLARTLATLMREQGVTPPIEWRHI